MKPRLSVDLPVHDGLPFLAEAVGSLLAQTFREFTLVAVDDGSTDGSSAFLRSISDPRVRVAQPPARRSLAAVHRFGVEATDSELVALMGQDDVAMPTRLERQVALLDADPTIGLVGCWATMIDERGRRVGALRYAPDPGDVARGLMRNTQIVAPTMLFRRAAYDAVGGFVDDCGYAFDYDFVLRVARQARCANVPDELLAYRYRPSAASVAGARAVQRGALRARWRELRRGGRDPRDALWLAKPLIALALPPRLLRSIIVPYMRIAHGREGGRRR